MAVTALYTAATGMQAMSTKIDVIANNLANSDTVGYKARANFRTCCTRFTICPGLRRAQRLPPRWGLRLVWAPRWRTRRFFSSRVRRSRRGARWTS